MRTVALPDKSLSPDAEPFPVRVLFFCRDPLLLPKMLVLPSEPEPEPEPEPLALPSLGSSFELKNGSSPHDESSGTSVPSWRASIATMMFSLTPARLSWIMRSDVRSKFGILEAMMSTIVFSLKPALTSLITSAFVIGPSSLVCACTPKADPANSSKVIRVVGKKDFIAHPL